ncbi:MAG: calcium/sodium antiporter [Bacteroidota bacterium]|nr:calcium/sodium antiporter [Bacteroidota bacterium]
MLLIILKLLAGFALLLLGGKYLVKGAVEITKYFNISKLVVGLTVVAFGTSAPELLVSVQAALKGVAVISLGNVIGSNIANVALVLAISVIILPISVKKQTIKFDWPIMFFAFVLFWLFLLDDKLTFIEGAIFFTLLILYVAWEIKFASKHSSKTEKETTETVKKDYSIPIAILVIIIASAALAFGADLLVESASALATIIGISERVIAISIVAVGTSLPELTASIIAALKKETDISVGNIIGSNIFNIFSILGITAMIKTIHFDHTIFTTDLMWMSGIGILLFLSFFPIKKTYINRYKGVIMLSVYFVYMFILFQR